ncbi:MAG: DNA sulfur modification protein DndB [Gammaproteobacteria bacterium]|nr:DNA sulfur modification protein DndB [Gammaproteobacteria bacterium]MYF38347.1 DNA sulfur modification protein DndB [Gammaproteobacteria bacterium]
MTGFVNSFPAILGFQAGHQCYTTMCPMRLLPRIFVFDDDEVPPELRAQRTLNYKRIPEMARYLIENPKSYVFSAITATVDTSIKFVPVGKSESLQHIGTLHIPMDAKLLINDGQHRRAAIEEALKERPEFGHEHIPVLFFVDEGLTRSQQIFADLNRHAIRPSDSLSTLYDQRDPSSELARYVVLTVEGFRGMTEMEKSSVSNRSNRLFTLSGIKHACRALLRKGRKDEISAEEKQFAASFWTEVVKNIPDWNLAKQRKLSSSDLRQKFIHAHGVAIHAIGMMGADLVSSHPDGWERYLTGLSTIDWSRENPLWENRAMVHGRISKARSHVRLTASAIKMHLGLPLTGSDEELECQVATING